MANLAIKGHTTRGKEVIEILEMLGGVNYYDLKGAMDNCFYYICNSNEICRCLGTNVVNAENVIVYTLEEFLEKYPYKVGDKVTLDNKLCSIRWMYWEYNNIYYHVQGIGDFFTKKVTADELMVEDLQFYKEEETMEESTNKVIFDGNAQSCDIMNDIIKKDIEQTTIDIPEGYEFFGIDDNKIILTKKQPQYPKTYEECEASGFSSNPVIVAQAQGVCLCSFAKLIVLRGAYWKIAGEQMGLGKPWEPDWSDETETYYTISYGGVNIKCYNCTNVYSKLAFPTEEMRDAFYENFKDLIEQCKELL